MEHTIIQWNLNGFYRRLENLQRLTFERKPEIICLQETHFKSDSYGHLRGYKCYIKNRPSTHASGGVATYVKNDVHCTHIKLNTTLEVVAVECYIPNKITICNVYLPNSTDFRNVDLESIKDQLPKPFIILGDFNSHNSIWGSLKTDTRGVTIEQFLDNSEISLLNETLPTHFNISNGSVSAVDLSISSACIADSLKWEVSDELYDSDHYPIIIRMIDNTYNTNPTSKTTRKIFNFKKTDWLNYQIKINENIISLESPNLFSKLQIDKLIDNFNKLIHFAANQSLW